MGRRRDPRTCTTMRRPLLNSERLGWMALWLMVLSATSARAAAPPAPAQAVPDEPAQWLDRMNKALTTTNYDGTYSLWLGQGRAAAHHPSRAGRRGLRAAGVA